MPFSLKLHIHITGMIINILFRVFENWSIHHSKIAQSDFLSFTNKQENRMTPVGLSWQTVFAAIRVKYSSPPLIYPLSLLLPLSLYLVSVWKRWFMPVSLSPSTTLYNIMWTGLSFSAIWSCFSEARLWRYVRRVGRRKRRKFWVWLVADWLPQQVEWRRTAASSCKYYKCYYFGNTSQ